MASNRDEFYFRPTADANFWKKNPNILAGKTIRHNNLNLRIGSCLVCIYRVMDARGKFEEHGRSVTVARGADESNSSFLSALQTSQVHP